MSGQEPGDVARFAPNLDGDKVEPGALAGVPAPGADFAPAGSTADFVPTDGAEFGLPVSAQGSPDPNTPAGSPAVRESWEDFHNQSRDVRERTQTRMRAMATNATLGLEFERRQAKYSTLRTVLIWFWSIALVPYLIALIYWSFGSKPPTSLGAVLWLASMIGAIGLYLSWMALKVTHPGQSPVAPLPDNAPRHEGLAAHERPSWDRGQV